MISEVVTWLPIEWWRVVLVAVLIGCMLFVATMLNIIAWRVESRGARAMRVGRRDQAVKLFTYTTVCKCGVYAAILVALGCAGWMVWLLAQISN